MAATYPKLNFPAIKLKARRNPDSGAVSVWDSLRGHWLVLTPEEWVRRHVIGYLTSKCGVEPLRIVQEYAVALNGQPQRADIVVVDGAAQPLVLVECKATSVPIDMSVLSQAVRYNSVVQARYIMITNGVEHRCYQRHGVDYQPLGDSLEGVLLRD